MRTQQTLHGLDILLLGEPRKVIQVVQRGVEHLGLVDVLAVVAPLGYQRIEDQRRLGQRERIHALELAQIEVRGGFFVARGWGFGTRRSLVVGHGGSEEFVGKRLCVRGARKAR